MKKTVWSDAKSEAFLRTVLKSDGIFLGMNKKKHRRRKALRLHMTAKRPQGGYKRYTVRRSKPWHTWDSEENIEENRYFWKEVY